MQLYLIDQSPEVVDALRNAFADYPEVSIEQGDLLATATDTVVSPANSLGVMDGGLDNYYLQFFGLALQSRVQELLARLSEGSLPVGMALLVATGDARIRNLLVAPTVLVPGPTTPANVYFAMSAVLRTASRHSSSIQKLYCPGLGTGIGQVSPDEAAREMANAYRNHRQRANAEIGG